MLGVACGVLVEVKSGHDIVPGVPEGVLGVLGGVPIGWPGVPVGVPGVPGGVPGVLGAVIHVFPCAPVVPCGEFVGVPSVPVDD